MKVFDIDGLITFTDNNHRDGKIGKVTPKRIIKEDVDMKRHHLVDTLSRGMARYIGVYRDNIKGITKPLIEIKNGLAVTMTDSALENKVERIVEEKKCNSYFRSLIEDFTNIVVEKTLNTYDSLILREVSLEGLKASPKVFEDEEFLDGSNELRIINSFKRAINDFLIQVGDKTLVLSIASIGHSYKYDSNLEKINDSYFLNNVLGVGFLKLDVPINENGVVEYEKYLEMLLNTLNSYFRINIEENKVELLALAKKRTFKANIYHLMEKLDMTEEEAIDYMLS